MVLTIVDIGKSIHHGSSKSTTMIRDLTKLLQKLKGTFHVASHSEWQLDYGILGELW